MAGSAKFSAAIARATRNSASSGAVTTAIKREHSSSPVFKRESQSPGIKREGSSELSSPPLSSELSSPPASSEDEGEASPYFAPKASSSKRQRIKKEPPKSMGDVPSILPLAKRKGNQKPAPSSTPPPNWEDMYSLTKTMRLSRPAPVDTMGCERTADAAESPLVKRFQTLISLMLSSQTKDTVNAATMDKLRAELPGGLNLASVLTVEPAELNRLIASVGFHRRKTEYIKRTAVVLRDEWRGDIPDSIEGLVALPGVGPKMAHLCMSHAWDKDMGIGVDVHVHRIANLWGWVESTTPEGTREQLEAWLPKDKWREINWLLVGFGQTTCLPRGRKCGDCLLSKGLCKAAFMGNSAPKRRKGGKVKMEEAEDEDEDEDVKVEVKGESDAEYKLEGGSTKGLEATPRRRPLRRGVAKVEVKTEDGWEGMPDIEDAVGL
ncbi:DNA repair protein-like protein Ntg1 [Tricharina praecox]|uniref:DNA repair protein-like protein Ntg1 n=1 Tax=Tricharina praecox TaxID=43433 RepID=UPI00221FC208|nr:DNA repair protein-like protein Ntg1 [Tricharina praecox]KAI5853851.1 DNA repair protein-like protein Ntg1 [Tricharina praecox]